MHTETVVFTTFLIFTGAAILATLALYTRQSLLVAYILLGVALGPWGIKLIQNPTVVHQTGEVGIIFLLFLLGLHLQPQNLMNMLRKVTLLTLVSSVLFAVLGFIVSKWFGFNMTESIIVGTTMMFSSTIIGLKLLPTTILHHQHTGELMISVLLMQDILAIVTLVMVNGFSMDGFTIWDAGIVVVGLPSLVVFAFAVERFILVKLLARFDRTQEYVFLLSIGWCLGLAELGRVFGLSEEIGAFIAGVALASSPIAMYIAECLKPLRDFFLVMFFFSIGAGFNFAFLRVIIVPACLLAGLMLLVKPLVYRWLLKNIGESSAVSKEVGIRLGQCSEFSLLIVSLVMESKYISLSAVYLVQATTIITFLISSYWVVLKYPTPIALTDKMRRD